MKKNYHKIYALAVFLLIMMVPFQDIMAQCAMCRATIENNVSDGVTGLASGLNLGIMYLFMAPYLVVSVIAFMWYKKSKANARKIKFARPYRS